VSARLHFCENPINDSAKFNMFRFESSTEEIEEYDAWKNVNKAKSEAIIEAKIEILQNKLIEDNVFNPDRLLKIESKAYLNARYDTQLKGYSIQNGNRIRPVFSLKVAGDRSTLGQSLRATVFEEVDLTNDLRGLYYQNKISFGLEKLLSDVIKLQHHVVRSNAQYIYSTPDESDAYEFSKKIAQNGTLLIEKFVVKPTGCSLEGKIQSELVGYHLSFSDTNEKIVSWGVML
jgi:hypothetical protein